MSQMEMDTLSEEVAAETFPAPDPDLEEDFARPKGLENKASPPFAMLVQLLERIEVSVKRRERKRFLKRDLLKLFFTTWREIAGNDLYPAIRLMLPERDTRRRTYQLKEQKLAKVYILALDLPPKSADAKRLETWKVPTANDSTAGNFSMVAFSVIQSRSTVVESSGSMTIDDVNHTLDLLSKVTSSTNPASAYTPTESEAPVKKKSKTILLSQIIKTVAQKMTPTEQKWFIRIILKDLKVGINEKSVLYAFHPDAVDLFNTCSDLLRVCWTLYDPNKRLKKSSNIVSPGSVFRPMLCGRSQRNFDSVVQTMSRSNKDRMVLGSSMDDGALLDEKEEFSFSGDEFIIEEKYDGERIQLHKIGNKYSYFSRQAIDYTALYGPNPENGSLTPYIHNLFKEEIQEVILDGEMMVWDPVLLKYMSFGNLKTFANKSVFGKTDARPCFMVFDILYIRGAKKSMSLMNIALAKRKKLLSQVVTPLQGVLEITPYTKASTSESIATMLRSVLGTKGEGLVIKNPAAKYILGRRALTWIKIKPDYMDELGEHMDVLIIGAYWGVGKHQGRHSSFLVGLREEEDDVDSDDEDSGNVRFLSFCRVGIGFNLDTYTMIEERTKGYWRDYRPGAIPEVVLGSEKPDQVIEPSHSFVISVKASEITVGLDYAAEMTLRFPRMMRVRDDIAYNECMTLGDIRHLKSDSGKRKFTGDEDMRAKKKKKVARLNDNVAKNQVVAAVTHAERTSDLFDGFLFYVSFFKSKKVTKADIEKVIFQYGGEFIQKPPDKDADLKHLVIASQYDDLAQHFDTEKMTIVHYQWVIDCAEQGEILPFSSKYRLEKQDAAHRRSMEVSTHRRARKVKAHFVDDASSSEEEKQPEEKQPVETEAEPSEKVAPTTTVSSADEGATQSEDSGGENGLAWIDEGEEDDTDKDIKEEAEDDNDESIEALMGERDSKDYDEENIFRPFVFYLDTISNAKKNALRDSSKPEKVQERASMVLDGLVGDLTSRGGVVTDSLYDPKLTHVIMHKLVVDRFLQIMDLTRLPRYRKIVTSDWVSDSISFNSGPLDEGDYRP